MCRLRTAGWTLEAIGKRYGITREAVRQAVGRHLDPDTARKKAVERKYAMLRERFPWERVAAALAEHEYVDRAARALGTSDNWLYALYPEPIQRWREHKDAATLALLAWIQERHDAGDTWEAMRKAAGKRGWRGAQNNARSFRTAVRRKARNAGITFRLVRPRNDGRRPWKALAMAEAGWRHKDIAPVLGYRSTGSAKAAIRYARRNPQPDTPPKGA